MRSRVLVYEHLGSRISQDLAPRLAALDQVLIKWGAEVRKHHGEKGYHLFEHRLRSRIYINASLHSSQVGELKSALRYLLVVTRLQPTHFKLIGWLAYKLVRATWKRVISLHG
ncbi:MAG: hypothetical protein ACYCZF_13975 [Anaerolineae bacterium]